MRRLISRAVPGLLEGVSPLLAPLLLARGVDTPDKLRVFLHPAAQDLHDERLLISESTLLSTVIATVTASVLL